MSTDSPDAAGPKPAAGTERSRVPLNAALLSSAQLARTLIGFLFFLFLARQLNPTGFGQYMFAFALSEIFSIVGDVGLHEYCIREISRRPGQLRERLAGILSLKTLLSSLSAIIMVLIVPLMGKDRATSYAVIAFAVAQIGYSWFYGSSIAFSVRQDLHIQAFLWLMEKALFAGAGVAALLVIKTDFVGVALSNTFVQFFGGILAVLIVWRKYGPLAMRLDRERWLGYLKAALPFGLIVAFYLVYFRVDSVMISFFRTDAEVGQYNAAYNLISALLFLPSGLVAAMFPKLAGAYRSPTDNLDAPFGKASRYLLVMALPMAVGGWLLSSQLMTFLFGGDYAVAANAMALLAWTLPVWFLTFLQGNILTIIERQKAVALVGLVNMIFNVLINLAIIPRYGFTGAAATTLLTEVLGMLQMFWLLRRNISMVHMTLLVLRIAVMAGAMGVLVWVLRDRLNVLLVVAIAGAAYAVAVLALRVIPLSEITAIVRRAPRPGEDEIGPVEV